jgi:uncharacterized protein (DUF608 family)
MRRWKETRYSGERRTMVALPLGGLGAGCLSLNGWGGLQDFAIRHRPAVTAQPDGHRAGDAAFALLRVGRGEEAITRLVEGPLPPARVYAFGLKSQGLREGGHEGLPRFRTNTFRGSFPYGWVDLRDPAVPLAVTLRGWSPFVPLDDRASGMPCAVLDYTLRNPGTETVAYEFSFHLSHLAPGADEASGVNGRNAAVPGRGIRFFNTEAAGAEAKGSAALFVVGHAPRIKAAWLRGGWFDSLTALWREVSTGRLAENDGAGSAGAHGRNGGSVWVGGELAPGAAVTIPMVIAWHFPNCLQACGEAPAEVVPPTGDEGGASPAGGADGGAPRLPWHPYYATLWPDAAAVAEEAVQRYAELDRRTAAFHRALVGSTLPAPLLEAVSANLAILKSPTVLRQANGNVWGWEGCFADRGCCHGTCTHVWNYAQSLPQLFPALERTLREQEWERSMDARGHVNFRARLPDGPATHGYHAAADGQLGGILKLYRDWQISGDRGWLERLYPAARRSLEYGIATWDPDETGGLIEPHHNTYDIEFWGPDGMCTTIYAGALRAMARMAAALAKTVDAQRYETLARRSLEFLRRELFNGEYFQQQVRGAELRDRSFAETLAGLRPVEAAELEILRREGPKYQYGSGCLSDGVIGAWMAELYGVPLLEIRDEVRATLRAIFRHNFRADLTGHACTQRPGYAVAGEGGLLLCTWPRGDKPTLPFIYCDEVWTGIEYQVASHLLLEGMVKEAVTIVAAARARYDGRIRNPFDEYECGSFYARAMASFALLNAAAGFRYSAVDRVLELAPRVPAARFSCLFSTATGWGTLALARDGLRVALAEGELALERVQIGRGAEVRAAEWCGTVRAGRPVRIRLPD